MRIRPVRETRHLGWQKEVYWNVTGLRFCDQHEFLMTSATHDGIIIARKLYYCRVQEKYSFKSLDTYKYKSWHFVNFKEIITRKLICRNGSKNFGRIWAPQKLTELHKSKKCKAKCNYCFGFGCRNVLSEMIVMNEWDHCLIFCTTVDWRNRVAIAISPSWSFSWDGRFWEDNGNDTSCINYINSASCLSVRLV